jgi:ankyrin repeat protein
MVALLLEFGANVDASSESGLTPLGYAAAAGFLSIVVLLCKKRAKVATAYSCCFSSSLSLASQCSILTHLLP